MPGYGSYLTSDGRWVYLLTLTDAHWAKLTKALDMPEAADESMARLRDRKKQRDTVEAAVRAGVGKFAFAEVEARLGQAGLGFAEVMPLERVLEKPQARQPGKLRDLSFRGLSFEVPEFPGQAQVDPGLPPPELGEHTVEVLRGLGYDQAALAALLDKGAVKGFNPAEFTWAPVRDKS
jgi:crotonobetainyl-CoA:carnitine CoA-transferase CaiB-like acyl-CoA transferase